MSSKKLREWRGMKPVAAPSGVAITTRVRTGVRDGAVLARVAAHVCRVRRADLGARTGAGARQDNTTRASRKRGMTAVTSSRMAGTIMRGNDDQYRLARMAQGRDITGLRASVATIEKRLAAPVPQGCKRSDLPKGMVGGYVSRAERYAKQQRLQVLKARLARAEQDRAAGIVHVVAGGKRLAKVRTNLDAAGMTLPQWRQRWDAARDTFEANGAADEPYGNLTITVEPGGRASIRLPKPLEHLANAPRGRYVLAAVVTFAYRGADWAARVSGGGAVAYTFARRPGRDGWYLTAAWSAPVEPLTGPAPAGAAAGVDLNDGHLAVRRLDVHGNPVGAPFRVDFHLSGPAPRRDAQVRHAITRLIRWCVRHGIDTIAVEDLDFADARTIGRETMGRGAGGKTFRRVVAAIPTAVFRDRLAGMTANTGLRLLAVNPAHSSAWGAQHWQKPYGITRHEAAATVIGRRAQGYRARRRAGVTRGRPEDRPVRATAQAPTRPPGARNGRRWTGTRGGEARALIHDGTRPSRRATVAPAPLANSGQRQQ